MAYTRPAASASDATWYGEAAYTRPSAASADASFLSVPTSIATAASPLGAVLALAAFNAQALAAMVGPLGTVSATGGHCASWVSVPSMLGTVSATGGAAAAWAAQASPLGFPSAVALFPVVSIATASSPLGAALAKAFHDFTGLLGDSITHYVMDLTTPDGTVRVPISSWQATLQTGASNYVQCVVPAVADWTAAINAATAFTITRTAEPAGLPVVEYEMASAPLETISIAQGPTNYTATLSGYSPAFAVDEAPPAATDRTLIAVRSVTTTSGKMRARCAIDWTLRPAQRAYLPDGSSFVVGYINYYQPQGFDSYMDVGE